MTAPSPPVAKAASFNLLDPEMLACPHAAWQILREQSPVHRLDIPTIDVPSFAVTRRRDLQFICQRQDLFSGAAPSSAWRWGPDMGPALNPIFDDGGYRPVHTLVTSDPPDHAEYRRVIMDGLTAGKLRAVLPVMEAMVTELTDSLPSGTEVEFMDAYAVPLPLRVINLLLGLPRADEPFLVRLADEYMKMVDPSQSMELAIEATKVVVEGQKYLAEWVHRYRAEPAENLMSSLANARRKDGTQMSMGEVLSMAVITVIGGNETTRHALGNAAYALARQPELWRQLQREPAKIANFIEEVLRTEAPATATARRALQDVELGGVQVPAGSCLFMLWGSGSRDDAAFTNAGEIDLDRTDGRGHVTFGHGAHFCAGSQIARAELTYSLEAWLRQFEKIEFAVPADEIVFAPALAFRALKALPLIFTRH